MRTNNKQVNERINDLKNFQIRAKRKLTRMQYFILLMCNHCYLSYQQTISKVELK